MWKRKITRSGGKCELHFDYDVTKVGLEVFRDNDSLPIVVPCPSDIKIRALFTQARPKADIVDGACAGDPIRLRA